MKKPSGWLGKKDDQWWTKPSASGLQYMCPQCGKKSLGIVWGEAQKRMHFSNCLTLNKADSP